MRAVKEKANAKINLFLDVIAKRVDGFHDVKTVMQSVTLADNITVTYIPSAVSNVRLTVKGNRYIPTDEKNLAVRAAKLYLSTAGITASIDITLEKRIPVAAGLAGGSSDAAATLRAMNRLFGKLFTERALYGMAAHLGSDVPYCLYGKTALCEGRGEIITKLPDLIKLNLVIAVADEHISTPSAYSQLDSIFASFDGSVSTDGDFHYEELLTSFEFGELNVNGLFNVFESVVLPVCPGAAKIKQKLAELGAKAVLMSGSGPSVFGVFENEDDAQKACLVLRNEKTLAYCVKSI